MSKSDHQYLIEEALNAFWDVIVKRYPEARTGDLSPLTTMRLDEVARIAVDEWICSNVPKSKR